MGSGPHPLSSRPLNDLRKGPCADPALLRIRAGTHEPGWEEFAHLLPLPSPRRGVASPIPARGLKEGQTGEDEAWKQREHWPGMHKTQPSGRLLPAPWLAAPSCAFQDESRRLERLPLPATVEQTQTERLGVQTRLRMLAAAASTYAPLSTLPDAPVPCPLSRGPPTVLEVGPCGALFTFHSARQFGAVLLVKQATVEVKPRGRRADTRGGPGRGRKSSVNGASMWDVNAPSSCTCRSHGPRQDIRELGHRCGVGAARVRGACLSMQTSDGRRSLWMVTPSPRGGEQGPAGSRWVPSPLWAIGTTLTPA